MGFEVFNFLPEQACFPLPERLQIVLFDLNRHLILLEINHWVAQDLDCRHRRSVALAVSNTRNAGIATWQVFKSWSNLVLKLLDSFLGKQSLLKVLCALIVVLLSLVDEALDKWSQLLSLLGGCLYPLMQDQVGGKVAVAN